MNTTKANSKNECPQKKLLILEDQERGKINIKIV